ncbi:MAG: hypothetical protein HYY84_18005 [Deltaproteobacteria bacterium]|nr:hypothetical protein [Deltaproteobacteria bacterium]
MIHPPPHRNHAARHAAFVIAVKQLLAQVYARECHEIPFFRHLLWDERRPAFRIAWDEFLRTRMNLGELRARIEGRRGFSRDFWMARFGLLDLYRRVVAARLRAELTRLLLEVYAPEHREHPELAAFLVDERGPVFGPLLTEALHRRVSLNEIRARLHGKRGHKRHVWISRFGIDRAMERFRERAIHNALYDLFKNEIRRHPGLMIFVLDRRGPVFARANGYLRTPNNRYGSGVAGMKRWIDATRVKFMNDTGMAKRMSQTVAARVVAPPTKPTTVRAIVRPTIRAIPQRGTTIQALPAKR